MKNFRGDIIQETLSLTVWRGGGVPPISLTTVFRITFFPIAFAVLSVGVGSLPFELQKIVCLENK